MNQNFLVKKLIEVFYKKLTRKAFDNLRNSNNSRRRNTLRLHTMKSSTHNIMGSLEDNTRNEPIKQTESAHFPSSKKIILKNTQNIDDKDTKSYSRPMKYGDIIYLTFDMINNDGMKQKGIIMGKSLSGDKINARYIDPSIYDSSMKKCLFQILSKSEIKEENIFGKGQLLGLLMSQNDDFAEKLAKYKKQENEKKMSYTRNFGNYVLFGQSFALKHLHSGCYFNITHDELNIAQNSLMINLCTKESEDCYMKFFPTSKVKNLGEVIRYGDYQFICKSSDKFVYIGAIAAQKGNKLFLDASKREFEWKINFYSTDENFNGNSQQIKASDIVQIYHSDYKGYLSLKNTDNKKKITKKSYKFTGGTSNNYMKKNSIIFDVIEEDKKDVYQVEFESTDYPSIFSYWEIKSENILDTSSLNTDKIIRLKNIVTGSYICVSGENNVKMVVAKPYTDTNDINMIIKQKISNTNDDECTYDDLFKLKSETTQNYIYISQLALSTKTVDKWKLNDDLLVFNPSIGLADKNKYVCKPNWGKNRHITSLFKFKNVNKKALFLYKISSIKSFLNKFMKFIQIWGTKQDETSYYIDYETAISDLNQLEEAYNNFNANIKHLLEELLLYSDNTVDMTAHEDEKTFRKRIGNALIDIGLIDSLVEIIRLIDFRIHKTCFKLVDYNDNTLGMQEFYKYKRLKNLINDKKFVELPQLVGKNVFDKIIIHSIQLLSIYANVNDKIKKQIATNGELFINLLFFYEEECTEICHNIFKPSKESTSDNDKLLEYFMDKFFYSEDNVQSRINLTKYYTLISNVINYYSYNNKYHLLEKIFNFFFKADLQLKFIIQDGRVYFYLIMNEAEFERLSDKNKDLSSFVIDFSDRSNRYIDIASIRVTMNFVNMLIQSSLTLMKTFLKIPPSSKEIISMQDFLVTNVLNSATAFEILHIQCNYQLRSVVLDLANHLLYFGSKIKNITDYLSNYSLLFFTDVQQKFSKKLRPIEWMNSVEVVKPFRDFNEKIISCYLDFCSLMNKFGDIYSKKDEQELRYFKELLKFIKKCLNHGLFDFFQIKEIYEKILKFLHESIYDEKAKKKTTVMYLSILKTHLVFTNKNKQINEWVHLFYEVEYYSYEILKFVNQFRLYYQINLLAKYSIKQCNGAISLTVLKTKCDYVFDILRLGPNNIDAPMLVNIINQDKSSKKKSLFTSHNKIKSINDTTFLRLVDRKGRAKAPTNDISYHFELKFLDYYQKNYEKLSIYNIYWKEHFDFTEVHFFTKQMHMLKKIPKILLYIYSEYFKQREILYKVLKQSEFMINQNVYMDHEIVLLFVENANFLIKTFKGDHNNTLIQEKVKLVKRGYSQLNKQLIQLDHQKVFFAKFQNYLSCMNLLHITVDLLNSKNLTDDDLLDIIFEFLELMVKNNQMNQLFLLPNLQNFMLYLLEGFSTSKIIVSLLSAVNNINEINKVIKYIFASIDSILKDCDSIFDIFKTEDSADLREFDKKMNYNKAKLKQISLLNELLIMIIDIKDNIKIDKLKRVIFLCLMNNKKLENLFSIYEPKAMKTYIQSKRECSKELVNFFYSFYMLISNVLTDCPFAINTFKNIISSEKFIYFFKINRGHYIFKLSMLKIYSTVYLDKSLELTRYDYITEVLDQIITVDIKSFVYFIRSLLDYTNNNVDKQVNEIYNKLNITRNDDFVQNAKKVEDRILLNPSEYWGYLFTKSANQNYGLLYFTYDILKVLIESMNSGQLHDIGLIAQTEQKIELIKAILNENRLTFQSLKQLIIHLNDITTSFPVKDYIMLIDSIDECIESIITGKNLTENKDIKDRPMDKLKMNIKAIRDLKERIVPTEDNNNNLNDTQLSSENDESDSVYQINDFVKNLKEYILTKKLDFYNFLNNYIFSDQISNQNKYSNLLKKLGLQPKNYPYNIFVKSEMDGKKIQTSQTLTEPKDDFISFLHFFVKIEEEFYHFDTLVNNNKRKYQDLYNKLLTVQPLINEIEELTKCNEKFMLFMSENFLTIKHAHNEITYLKQFVKNIIFDYTKNANYDHFLNAKSLMKSHIFIDNEDGLFVILYCIRFLLRHEIKKKTLYKNDEASYYRKITMVQNHLDTRDFTHLILYIISNYNSQKLTMISLQILIDILKYGNTTIQQSIYNLITTDPKLSNFLLTCKHYIKRLRKKLFADLVKSKNNEIVSKSNLYENLIVSFFGSSHYKLLTNFFHVIQNFCENCNSNFQLFLCNPIGVSNPINFVYIITEFFIKRSTIIVNEHYKPMLNAKEKLKNKIFDAVARYNLEEEKLMLQTYNTIEDFLLGPCENNQIALMNNKKLIIFLKDIINKDFEHIIQNYNLLVIFILSIKIICLLLNENNPTLLEKAKQVINADELMETLVLIYDNYVRNYNKQMFSENICTHVDFFGDNDDETNHCTKSRCEYGKLTVLHMKIVETGFEVFKILKTIKYPKIENYTSHTHMLKKMKKNSLEIDSVNFFNNLLDQVEVFYNGQIINVYFRIPYVCHFVSHKIINDIIYNTVRTSHYEKIENLINKVPIYIYIMRLTQSLSKNLFTKSIYANKDNIYNLKYLLIIAINLSLFFRLKYSNDSSYSFEDGNFTGNMFNLIKEDIAFAPVYFGLGFVIIILSAVIATFNFIDALPKVFAILYDKPRSRKNKITGKIRNIIDSIKYHTLRIYKTIKHSLPLKLRIALYSLCDTNFLFYLIVFVLSVLALIQPIFWGILLLEIIKRNSDMQNIIKSITINWAQLLKTAFLSIIIMYIYATIAFTYFPSNYNHSEDSDFKSYCNTLSDCFSSTVYNGLRAGGGIGEAIGHLTIDDEKYWMRFAFDLTFFIIVIICLLNIIFGIIIDTFAALRDKKNDFADLIANNCMICELNKFVIESKGEGWKAHIHNNHNINSYLNFLVYIREKNISDCSGVEKFVKESIKNSEYAFIPYLRSKYTPENSN